MSHEHSHDDNRPKHLAHHFDTVSQQFESGKLGMWVFLATELLMFGGLFVAYTIYRSNHPDIYMYAHQALDTMWGAINTVVLLLSSFTMAWAVRAAQLGARKLLLTLLFLTFLGGCGFMVIKTIEYSGKYSHGLWVGPVNAFYYDSKLVNEGEGGTFQQGKQYIAHHAAGDSSQQHDSEATSHDDPAVAEEHEGPSASKSSEGVIETVFSDHSAIALAPIGPVGTTEVAIADPSDLGHAKRRYPTFDELSAADQKRTHLFFQIYYCMTGLHGIHVLVGMGVIAYLFFKALPGTFNRNYFTPVEVGGLYWHLVDLIWIFLFPLLYLIH